MWQTLVVGPLSAALSFLADLFNSGGIPWAWGWAIITFTLVVKLVTLPLTLRQVQSTKRMQQVQPQLQALQKKYAGQKERLAQEQMALYKEAGVNPLGGCLPQLVQLPIWIGLYQALLHLANTGQMAGGFLWLQNLAFPNTQVGTSWIWPPSATNANFQGWPLTIGYLVLPILTVVTQIITQKLMTPPSTDKSQGAMNSAMMLMPFMFGFFALTFPSGLSLYWVTTNLFTMVQQYLVGGKPTPKPATATATSSAATAVVEPSSSSDQAATRVPRPTPKKR
ncbi:MAG: YidC/Oxa1 family membrane protein insertase, partial [Anaerolineae bacterium]